MVILLLSLIAMPILIKMTNDCVGGVGAAFHWGVDKHVASLAKKAKESRKG